MGLDQRTTSSSPLGALVDGLHDGSVEVVDLTHPLGGNVPYFQLPPDLGLPNQPGMTYHELSRYDERGPAWAWGWLEIGEHVGTHFDAPTHWVTGRDGHDVSSVPAARLVGPALVVDRVDACAQDPEYLLTAEDVRAVAAEHGASLDGAWLVLRTGWSDRIHDARAYLNDASGQQRTPGFDGECARWLAQETGILGVGVETLGIDAGLAMAFEPPAPAHHYLLGHDKYGLAQLANVDRLPVTGSVIVASPLRIPGGTGSPARVLALVPRQP